MTTPLTMITQEPQRPAEACVIWLHGLGADGNDFVDMVPLLQLDSATTRFIFPHAPTQPITINAGMSMRAWYDIVSLTDRSKEDHTGIIRSQQLVGKLINDQIQQGIASQQIILAGFSQGGAMALYTGLRYPQTLGGIIALSCYMPLLTTLADANTTPNQITPIFQAHGEQDDIVPLQFGTITHDALQQQGHAVAWHSYAMGHAVCPDEITKIGEWMNQLLRV